MTYKEKIDRLSQSPEDKFLLSRVLEKLSSGERKNIPANSNFLTLREQELVRRLVGEDGCVFFGGFPGAERRLACYLPDYLEGDALHEEDGPVACVRATYYEKDKLTHRDFLGSLMGSGVKRETIGDICVGIGQADFFVTREIAPYIVQNLVSAGRTVLHVEQIPLSDAIIPEPETVVRKDTLASLRLDSVMSVGFRISRSIAHQQIVSGCVAIDGMPTDKPDRSVGESAVISCRGLGKIRLTQVKGQTKKGRIAVEIEKFL